MSKLRSKAMADQERFNEDEVRKILAKSLRLQDNSRGEPKIEHGLTVHDLEQLAKEVGISPEFLHQAIRSSQDPFEIKEIAGFLGSPTRMEISGTVTGELNEEAISILTKKLRKDTRKRGILETVGKSFGWSTMASNEAELTFDALSTGGKTELNLRYSASNIKFLFYFFPILPLILSVVALFQNISIFLPIFAVFLTLGAVGHFAFKKHFKRQSQKYKILYTELEELAGAKLDQEEGRSQPKSGKLDLSEAEGYDQEEGMERTEELIRPSSSQTKRRIP